MSAQVIDLMTHRPHLFRVGAPTIPTIRTQIDQQVRGYCELLSLSPEQIGLCSAVAMQPKIADKSTTKVKTACSYYKLTVNGEVIIEFDALAMIFVVGGTDMLEAQRKAIGLA